MLLAKLLLQLGYKLVRVPAIVHADNGFRSVATHVFLAVTDNQGTLWFVDVGFGEPPLHPLRYEENISQTTPEGMESRFVRDDNDENMMILEWKTSSGEWSPRLKWNHQAALVSEGPSEQDFQRALETVHEPSNIFSRKLIVCLISRTKKITIAGGRLKVTTPRFGPDLKVSLTQIESTMRIREILSEEFGIPMEETEGLDLSKSTRAPAEIWSAM